MGVESGTGRSLKGPVWRGVWIFSTDSLVGIEEGGNAEDLDIIGEDKNVEIFRAFESSRAAQDFEFLHARRSAVPSGVLFLRRPPVPAAFHVHVRILDPDCVIAIVPGDEYDQRSTQYRGATQPHGPT